MQGSADTHGHAERARVFFALWPDAAVARSLHRLSGLAHATRHGRRTRRETLHLTLAFIGEVPRERLGALIGVGDRAFRSAFAPFQLLLERVASWRHNHITFVEPLELPPALGAFVEALRAELRAAGFATENRRFAAHVTLLRKSDAGPAAEPVTPPIAWPVDGFVLVESQPRPDGAHYEPLHRWTV